MRISDWVQTCALPISPALIAAGTGADATPGHCPLRADCDDAGRGAGPSCATAARAHRRCHGRCSCAWLHAARCRGAGFARHGSRTQCAGIGYLAGSAQIGRAPSELQSLMRISYAVFCLKKKKNINDKETVHYTKRTTQIDTTKSKS